MAIIIWSMLKKCPKIKVIWNQNYKTTYSRELKRKEKKVGYYPPTAPSSILTIVAILPNILSYLISLQNSGAFSLKKKKKIAGFFYLYLPSGRSLKAQNGMCTLEVQCWSNLSVHATRTKVTCPAWKDLVSTSKSCISLKIPDTINVCVSPNIYNHSLIIHGWPWLIDPSRDQSAIACTSGRKDGSPPAWRMKRIESIIPEYLLANGKMSRRLRSSWRDLFDNLKSFFFFF